MAVERLSRASVAARRVCAAARLPGAVSRAAHSQKGPARSAHPGAMGLQGGLHVVRSSPGRSPFSNQLPTLSATQAIIGAGAAGLAAATASLRAGLRVTVLEAGDDIGGVWRYTDEVESDPLGACTRPKVRSGCVRRCTLMRAPWRRAQPEEAPRAELHVCRSAQQPAPPRHGARWRQRRLLARRAPRVPDASTPGAVF